jgi:hypothetical protein
VIGVIANEHERAAVEEFFQLFKTPWEFHREGETYDVVLVSGDLPQGVRARLILVFGSEVSRTDRAASAVPLARHLGAKLDWRGSQIPLCGHLLTFERDGRPVICTTATAEAAGMEFERGNPRLIRLGYDLFAEMLVLLTAGQPVEHAAAPTLDLHIALLRELILGSGVSLLEIPPTPAGHDFAVCLTHDIDFVGIRRHKLDHTMLGFLHRATLGAAHNFIRGRVSFRHVVRCWKAVATLPFIHLGWAKDYWMPFEWYLKAEENLSPTYFLIPFKHQPGERVKARHARRRASCYDVTEIPEWVARVQAGGGEVGVHGIDAWHSVEKGREELGRVAAVTGGGHGEMGIRMHWLLHDLNTCRLLEQAGYGYDSTGGYNERPGYRHGTGQVFRPPGTRTLLELPMHIQDGALFFPQRLGLSEGEARQHCDVFVGNARKLGGVLTLLWHDRSHGPERFWGDFYVELIQKLKSHKAWFGTAGQVVGWFRKRRAVTFRVVRGEDGSRQVRVCGDGRAVTPPFCVRMQSAGSRGAAPQTVDHVWDGGADFELQPAVPKLALGQRHLNPEVSVA